MIIKRDIFSTFYRLLKNSRLKPLLGFGQKLAAEAEAWSGLKKSVHPPILVYQMGKVGSTSVSDSLKAARLKNYVFDIHFLSNDLNQYKKFYIDSGIVPVPYHIELGLALRKRIIKNKFNKFKIISLVRDPIARQISDVFQNPEIMGMNIRGQVGLLDINKSITLIEDKFSDLKAFDYVFEWFDRELKSIFGIDVFSNPFNRDIGWTVYYGDKADLLIIRMEDLSLVGEAVISEFLKTPLKISLLDSNVRSQTPEAMSYKYVKENMRIKREICKKVYNSQLVRHFYSEKHINELINRWSK